MDSTSAVVTSWAAGDPELSKLYSTTSFNYSWLDNWYGLNPYPTVGYPTYVDKTRQAFNVAKRLVKEKHVQTKTIDQFVMLVELIQAEL